MLKERLCCPYWILLLMLLHTSSGLASQEEAPARRLQMM